MTKLTNCKSFWIVFFSLERNSPTILLVFCPFAHHLKIIFLCFMWTSSQRWENNYIHMNYVSNTSQTKLKLIPNCFITFFISFVIHSHQGEIHKLVRGQKQPPQWSRGQNNLIILPCNLNFPLEWRVILTLTWLKYPHLVWMYPKG